MQTINLADKFAQFAELWTPKIIAELNGQQVKLAKIEGEFTWHSHLDEDELFLVIEGEMEMQFRDRRETVRVGEMIVVPRGVEHRPITRVPTQILMFEPTGTRNTGDTVDARTIADPEWI